MRDLYEILTLHHRRYPHMQFQDDIKLLYQHTFGCEHLIHAQTSTFDILKNEYEKLRNTDKQRVLYIPVSNDMVRMDVQLIQHKQLSLTTFHNLFLAGCQQKGTIKQYRSNLLILQAYYQIMRSHHLKKLQVYRSMPNETYQAVSHSKQYKSHYHPAYRLMHSYIVPYLDIFAAIDQHMKHHSTLMIAIEGHSASGKSTLASYLASVYDANVFHMDDFFLRPKQRTYARLKEPGGNVDYMRFYEDVLQPLSQQKAVVYSPYSCQKQMLMEPVSVPYKSINIIEGVYSMHPYFCSPYDIRIFLKIDAKEQRKRIEKRNGSGMLQRFLNEWIPMEQSYMEQFQTEAQCDIVIE